MTATTPVRVAQELARVAGGPRRDLPAALDDIGLSAATATAVAELVVRCGVPINTDEAYIAISVTHRDERTDHVLRLVRGEPVRAESSARPVPCRLVFELADLVVALYGSQPSPAAGTHRFERTDDWFMTNGDPSDPFRIIESYMKATTTVLAAVSSAGHELNALAAKHVADKWGLWHWFTPHYDRHFARLRAEPVRVLEIGIGGYRDPDVGGGSLRMWRDYFPRGHVFGVDYFAKNGLDEERITTVQGSQDDPDFLRALASEHGPFDIVIDDGSHINGHILTTFRELFPHVRNGGVYVIEDLWTAYAPGYGGQETSSAGEGTSIGLLKSVVDALHHEEWTAPGGDPDRAPYAASTVGLHVYRNIAFLDKGVNAEGRIPSFAPRTVDYY
ncbi:class I SAM-dependent methyltransferase [Lentzea sp. JNUCC 0626]|uniref:class I SAM-dependent methyltransferase n=1 Tax=Lentzea sp. JNUCC 0626 TaxID=3367513 RepID=UPI00374898A4